VLLARSIIHKPKIFFYEDPTDVMDEDIAKEIITLSPLIKHKWTIVSLKSILKPNALETLSWTMALLHHDFKIISYAKHIQ
jgi:ABC-type Mn2+/Zn2+ transport system ATPase subunit